MERQHTPAEVEDVRRLFEFMHRAGVVIDDAGRVLDAAGKAGIPPAPALRLWLVCCTSARLRSDGVIRPDVVNDASRHWGIPVGAAKDMFARLRRAGVIDRSGRPAAIGDHARARAYISSRVQAPRRP